MTNVSQLAYIYELRNFPEYKHLTETVLGLLRKQWEDEEMKPELWRAIDDTLLALSVV